MKKDKCSFCGATSEDVEKLIAGPEAMICDECIMSCLEILVYGEPESIVIELDDDPESDEDAQSNSGC